MLKAISKPVFVKFDFDLFIAIIFCKAWFITDEFEFPKKYENIYEAGNPNIPYDIQILINREETGLTLLRLVQIIGEDKVIDVGSETLYFIVSVLNQLNLDKIRNKLLLKVLPLKV